MTIACEHCGQLACTTCDDAFTCTAGEHCSDSDCVSKCVDCQRNYIDEHQEVPC